MWSRLSKLLSGVAAIAAISAGSASHGQGGSRFRNADEARSYLQQNPTGPHAKEAFRMVVGERVARQHKEYPRDGKVPGRGRSVAGGSGLTEAQVNDALNEVSTY